MGKWIITCNLKCYAPIKIFSELDRIKWEQIAGIKLGDIVYIYLEKPMSLIKFETKVVKVNLTNDSINHKEDIINDSNNKNDGRYMELEILRKFDDNLLPYELLKDQGFKSITRPSIISKGLEEYILKCTSQIRRASERNYFFVFQNKSYNEEFKGGYLWAPQYGNNGRRVSHWEQMKKVRKGDLVIHSYSKEIVAISIAKTDYYESNKPTELSNEWDSKGWRVDTDYFTINNPIVTSDHMDKLRELQPEIYAPFNRIGRGNTGYLFLANREMAEYIIKESASNQKTGEDRRRILDLLKII